MMLLLLIYCITLFLEQLKVLNLDISNPLFLTHFVSENYCFGSLISLRISGSEYVFVSTPSYSYVLPSHL